MKIRIGLCCIIYPLLLTNLVACSTKPDETSTVDIPMTATDASSEKPAVTDNENWMVVNLVYAEEKNLASWLPFHEGFEKYWTPSKEDILKLEAGLAEYLQQNSHLFFRKPPPWEQLDEYQRQYIGVEVNGKYLIHGNYFCNNMGMDWEQVLIIVEDGGQCYFQLKYEVDSGNFLDLRVNGES